MDRNRSPLAFDTSLRRYLADFLNFAFEENCKKTAERLHVRPLLKLIYR